MKRWAAVLVVMVVALPLLSQVETFEVIVLDRVVDVGDFVRVSGGRVTSTPTPVPTEEPTAEPTEVPTEVPTQEPTEEPTEVPTAEPTEEPTEVPTAEPTEEPTEVPTEVPTQEPGGDQTYTLCLVPNGDWSGVTELACTECLATTEVVTQDGSFEAELLGPIPATGEYDVLLLDGSCNGALSLLASDDNADGPGVTVGAQENPVPSILVPGAVMLLALLALSGAIILRRA